MKKEGYSRPGLFGTMKHYDANGNKIGESRPGFFGSMNNYDANGHKVGHSSPVHAKQPVFSMYIRTVSCSTPVTAYDFHKI